MNSLNRWIKFISIDIPFRTFDGSHINKTSLEFHFLPISLALSIIPISFSVRMCVCVCVLCYSSLLLLLIDIIRIFLVNLKLLGSSNFVLKSLFNLCRFVSVSFYFWIFDFIRFVTSFFRCFSLTILSSTCACSFLMVFSFFSLKPAMNLIEPSSSRAI